MADVTYITKPVAKTAWEEATGPVAFYRVCLKAHFGARCWDTDVPYAIVSRPQTGGYPFTLTATAHRSTMLDPGPPSPPSDLYVITVPEPTVTLGLAVGILGMALPQGSRGSSS